MIRLNLTNRPEWLDLLPGLRVLVAPLTTALMVSARADPGMAALTGRIEVRFADSALVTQAIDGTPCELEFAYSLGANASFTFTAHAVYLPVPRIEIPGPQGIQATFDWQAAKATSPTRMCTAVLVNTVTGY